MPTAFDEIVDGRLLTRKIKEADHPTDSSIDAIFVEEDGPPRFMRNMNDKDLGRVLSQSEKPILRIFFLNVDGDTASGKKYSADALRALNQKAGMSKLLLSQMYQDSEWVGRFGNGCFVNNGWSPKDTTFEMVYYHCEPEFDHMLVNMVSTGTHTTYFVVNPTPNLYGRLQGQLEDNFELAYRLFFPDMLIVDEILKSFNDASAQKWEELAGLEVENEKPVPATQLGPQIEELSLEWLCLSQGLSSTSKQLEFLAQAYNRFFGCFTAADADGSGSDMESQSAVLIGLNGKEEKPVSSFNRGADDLLGFMVSKCQAQKDWIGTSRESTRMLMQYTQMRGQTA
ncbi:hypothetical protein MKZ38_009384 [Zalerion maritima]|uniref:Uncharacterized protein n=1 Tax=Zalerion maritima TaxID=339359 RepID=A0AAD5RK39_9PEZI|nr:hypothetical protein MKZ38_009384 [Zalerion maritima]